MRLSQQISLMQWSWLKETLIGAGGITRSLKGGSCSISLAWTKITLKEANIA